MTGLPSEHTLPCYDAIAEWYDACLRADLPVHALALPAVHELTGDVQGLEVCDLGCGQGAVVSAAGTAWRNRNRH